MARETRCSNATLVPETKVSLQMKFYLRLKSKVCVPRSLGTRMLHKTVLFEVYTLYKVLVVREFC